MMRSTEIAALRQLILDCADERGLEVDKIFEDELDMSTDQLSECLGVLLCADEPVMIVPDLSHFAGNGNPFHVKHAFEQEGIQVLSARRRPPPHIDIDPLKEVQV
jgi:hypothetical protein